MKKTISLNINSIQYDISVSPQQLLLDVIRDELGLIGTKSSCETGACGVCTVIIDGRATLACLTLAINCEGKTIETIEGIRHPDGSLHPIQKAFIEKGAVQCGFCTPGIIMTAKALLDENPKPSDNEIRDALAGTYCRCTGHIKTVDAIKAAIES